MSHILSSTHSAGSGSRHELDEGACNRGTAAFPGVKQIAYDRKRKSLRELSTTELDDRRQQFEAVKRWFYHDWMRIEPKLRTSIVEGISVFLSLFDDNPAVKRVFCPPKSATTRSQIADGRYGIPCRPFASSSSRARSSRSTFRCAPILDSQSDWHDDEAGLPARLLGAFPRSNASRKSIGGKLVSLRRVPCLCHGRRTDPTGDEKFFALPARPGASRSSPRKASVRCVRPCRANPGAPCCRPFGPKSSFP